MWSFPFLLFILVPYMYPPLFAYRHLFLTLWQGMASCDVKLEVNQNKTISTPPRCWKNQDSFEKEIQVDLIHLTHLRKNPRLFKLMSWRWNKHSKWAIRKVRMYYLSCLQLARSRGVYIKLWRLLGPLWIENNEKFEEFLHVDMNICRLFNKMFYVWDGNHMLQS